MLSRSSLLLVLAVLTYVQAQLFPRATPQATPAYSNTSSTTLTSSKTTPAPCCFVVQDTMSEAWWEERSYSTTHNVVNLTSLTTYMTIHPNSTSTRIVTNVYTTNATFNFTSYVGENPITSMINNAPGPAEVTTYFNGSEWTAGSVVTAGVTVYSPAAFYVYTTVRIITANPVTDALGNVACGTVSLYDGTVDQGTAPPFTLTFSGINSNQQAYFGGPGIVGPTEIHTYTSVEKFTITETIDGKKTVATDALTDYLGVTSYVNSKGSIVVQTDKPTGVVIALTTPFIYQPARGAKGETGEGRHCLQSGPKENWGYVPQTVIDFLASDPQYSAQYPGLESCLPGGPSIIQITACTSVQPESQEAGGDLTSSTIIYVTANAPVAITTTSSSTHAPTVESQVKSDTATAADIIATSKPSSSASSTSVKTSSTESPVNPASHSATTSNSPVGPTTTASSTTQTTQTSQSLGAIINSIFGNTGSSTAGPTTNAQPITISSPTTIPLSEAPTGAIGSTISISGSTFLVISSPTTITPAAPTEAAQPITIAGPTTIPASLAPAGLSGSITTIDGTPVVVVPSATTISPVESASLTVISGTTDVVITGPTTIPVNSEFSVSGQTTVVGGTTFVEVSGPTTVAITGSRLPSYVQNSGAGKVLSEGTSRFAAVVCCLGVLALLP